MTDLAAQADGKAAHRGIEGARMFRHVARQKQIADAVGCFGQLPQEMLGLFKGAVDITQVLI